MTLAVVEQAHFKTVQDVHRLVWKENLSNQCGIPTYCGGKSGNFNADLSGWAYDMTGVHTDL